MRGYREPDRPRDIDAELLDVYEADVARDKARAEKRQVRWAYIFSMLGFIVLLPLFGLAVWQGWQAGKMADVVASAALLLATVAYFYLRARTVQTEPAEAAKAYEKMAARVDTPPTRVGVDFGIPAEQLRVAAEPLDDANTDAPEAENAEAASAREARTR